MTEIITKFPTKEEWTAALRSGEYRQGFGMLARATNVGTEYCCLGVYQDLCINRGINMSDSCPVYIEDGKFHFKGQGTVASYLLQSMLAHLNDGQVDLNGKRTHKSFQEIADWIDQNLTFTGS